MLRAQSGDLYGRGQVELVEPGQYHNIEVANNKYHIGQQVRIMNDPYVEDDNMSMMGLSGTVVRCTREQNNSSYHHVTMIYMLLDEFKAFPAAHAQPDETRWDDPAVKDSPAHMKSALLHFNVHDVHCPTKACINFDIHSRDDFWDRIQVLRLRHQGRKEMYVVMNSVDGSRRLSTWHVPPPTFPSSAARAECEAHPFARPQPPKARHWLHPEAAIFRWSRSSQHPADACTTVLHCDRPNFPGVLRSVSQSLFVRV